MATLPIAEAMVADPREALAHVAFASQLVALAAVLETAGGAQNRLTRAAMELRRLTEDAPESSSLLSGRILN